MLMDALREIVIFPMKVMSKHFPYIYIVQQTSTHIIIYTNNIITKSNAHNRY